MGLLSSIGDAVKKVTGGIGDALGGIGGGLLDFGSSFLGNQYIGGPNAKQQFKYNKKAAKYSFDLSYDAYKHRYRDTMHDMKKAGLNPILALAKGGMTVQGQPQMNAASTSMPAYTPSSASSAYKNLQQAQLDGVRQDTERANRQKALSEAKAKSQEILESIERIHRIRAEKKLITRQEEVAFRNVKNLQAEYFNLNATYNLLWNQAELASQNAKLSQEQVNQLVAQRKQILAMTGKIEAELAELSRVADVYRSEMGKILGWMKAVKNAMPINIGIFGGRMKK